MLTNGKLNNIMINVYEYKSTSRYLSNLLMFLITNVTNRTSGNYKI